jgi:hypothetical protein
MNKINSKVFVAILGGFIAVTFAAGIAKAQNFDELSFGKNVQFAGAAMSGVVTLSSDCTPDPSATPGPDDRCVVTAAAPATTTYDFRDIGRLTLPKNTVDTIIYQVTNVNYSYVFQNTTGAMVPSARFSMVPYLTLESPALNDPRCIDPSTGLPCNGKIDESVTASTTVQRSLVAGEQDLQTHSFSRCGGAGIGRATLEGQGIPSDVVDKMFKKPITIRLNVRGTTRYVVDASVFYQLRVFVDK